MKPTTATPAQSARASHEARGADDVYFLQQIDMLSLVMFSATGISKVLIDSEGKVVARYLFLVEKDKWGSPWMIQDAESGDDDRVTDEPFPLALSLTAEQQTEMDDLLREIRPSNGNRAPEGFHQKESGDVHVLHLEGTSNFVTTIIRSRNLVGDLR